MYRSPEGTGKKTYSRWLGPGVVVEQVGQSGYRVQIAEDRIIEAPTKFLKKYVDDSVGEGTPLFFHRRTERRILDSEGDDVEEVFGTPKGRSKLWFLVGLVGEWEAGWVDSKLFSSRRQRGVEELL